MKSVYSNPCIRCGKQRIDKKSWKEKIESHFGVSYIVHTETVCPDKECQIIVQEKLDALKLKSEMLILEREKRMSNIKKAKSKVKN
jgi:hypothetical protein